MNCLPFLLPWTINFVLSERGGFCPRPQQATREEEALEAVIMGTLLWSLSTHPCFSPLLLAPQNEASPHLPFSSVPKTASF